MSSCIRVKKPQEIIVCAEELKRKPVRLISDEQPQKIYWLHRMPTGNLTLRGSSS